MLTSCSFQLVFGRIYTFYSPKWVFLTAIGIFEVGSAICGAAPSSSVFILGRAIAGLGSCGIFSGAIIIVVHTVPLRKRPIFTGLIGGIFGVASVAGPLLGGVFTDIATWRWCFWINLPIGAVTVAILCFILKLPSLKDAPTSVMGRINRLDPLGTIVFLPGMVCLLLALQWGGSKYSWGNARIIVLLILFGLTMIVFVAIQLWKEETATVPPRIISNRSIASGVWYATCIGGSMILFVYFLPIWFQAIKSVSAVKSGVMSIPFVLALVISSIISGGLTTALGYYVPFMLGCSTIMSIGAGLLTTFETNTGHAKWTGYQFLYGYGLGMGMQQAGLAAQTCLPRKDVPTGASLMFFGQSLGGALFISIGENIFASRLISALAKAHIPNLDPAAVVRIGATDLKSIVDRRYFNVVLRAYNSALTKTFDVGVAAACLSVIGALAMEWKSVKGKKHGPGA